MKKDCKLSATIKGLLIIVFCGVGVLGLNNRANAYTCRDSAAMANESIRSACGYEGQGPAACGATACGTLWISNDNSENSVSSAINVTETDEGKVTVYLHGSVFYASESWGAGYIYIIKGDKRIAGAEINGKTDYAPFSFCSGREKKDCRIDRPGILNPWTQAIKANVVPIELDIGKLIDIEKNNVKVTNAGNEYDVKVQVYRCFGDTNPWGASGSVNCGSDTVPLKIVIPATFVGRSYVGSAKGSRGTGTLWRSSGENGTSVSADTLYYSGCTYSPKDKQTGCNVVFRHYLARKTSNKAISYTIQRQKSGGDWVDVKKTRFNPGSSTEEVELSENTIALKPGEKVCERLIFNPGSGNDSTATVCALMGGSAETSVDLKVRRPSGQNLKSIVAKPEDKLLFTTRYYPALQYAYRMSVYNLRVDNKLCTNGTNAALGTLFNGKNHGKDGGGCVSNSWKNSVSVQYNNKQKIINHNETYAVEPSGSAYYEYKDFVDSSNDSWIVQLSQSDVGKIRTADAMTNRDNEKKITPSKVEFIEHDEAFNGGQIVFSPVSSINYAIDVAGGVGSAGDGTNVQLYKKNGTEAQKWIFSKYNGSASEYKNSYMIVNAKKTNLALKAVGLTKDQADVKNSYNVALESTSKPSNCARLWFIEKEDGGKVIVRNACSNRQNKKMVLGVPGGILANGTNLMVYEYKQDNNTQKWNMYRGVYSDANVDTKTVKKSTVEIKVPYNFANNNVSMSFPGGSMLSANNQRVDYTIKVKERDNKTVGSSYATLVKDAKHGLRWCVANDRTWVEFGRGYEPYKEVRGRQVCKVGTLHGYGATGEDEEGGYKESDTLYPSTNDKTGILNNLPAGEKVCFQAWVWPVRVDGDEVMSSEGFSGVAFSNWLCVEVYQETSYLQVWGGNVYSDGRISTSVGEKQINDSKLYFGSFGELGVISEGSVTGFASGAALGYSGSSSFKNVITVPQYNKLDNTGNEVGGAKSESKGRLLFENRESGGVGVDDNIKDIESYVDNITKLSKELSGGENEIGFTIKNGDGEEISPTKVEESNTYIYSADSVTIRANDQDSLGQGITLVVYADNVTIASDLKYTDEIPSLSKMPRMIVFAKNGIAINCDTQRVDGLLVAKQKVETRDTANVCKKQLVINGAVVTNRLVAGRTYGAGEGANSIVPAEVINFDPTLYDLGVVGDGSKMKIVSSKELAPRY